MAHNTNPTSADAYHEEKHNRQTQERQLYSLLKKSTAGISDRQIASIMDLPCSLASARRNGVLKQLEAGDTDQRVIVLGKERDPVTGKKVTLWAIRSVKEPSYSTKALF